MSTLGRLYRGETRFDFIGKSKIWFLISAVAIAVSLGSMLFRGSETPCASLIKGLNCGIEFKGGLQLRAEVPEEGPLGDVSDLDVISAVRDAVSDAGIEGAKVQVATQGEGRSILVQTKTVTPEQREVVGGAVSEAVGSEITDSSQVAGSWGQQITSHAVRALLVFFVVVGLFITWRYEWKMAFAAMAAMIHDLLITAGIYSLVGFEVTPSTVIALLTILGYSLYDTVVVFDKVEENTQLYATTGRRTYRDSANLAVNQVFMRSLNTSLSTLLPVGTLLFVGAGLFGASTLKDLALALFIGILSGSYSSLFTAVPILAMLKEDEPRFRAAEQRLEKGREAAAAATTSEEPVTADQAERVPARSRPATRSRPPARARAGSKKAKRRKRR
ncbi:MAG: protein translocase subunit SecF [Actinobacteria bacterium]|nr:protein translocase subunit SecF [Actinomycetota bacterium]